MNPLLNRLLSRYLAPAGEEGSITDRGDDFAPTDETPEPAPAKAEKPTVLPSEAAAAEEAAAKAETDAAAEGEEGKEGKKDSRIPLSRHKDILAKERAHRTDLETKLAQYENGAKVAAVNEDMTKVEEQVLTMEAEYNKLLADGEIDKATALMSKIRQTERQIVAAGNDLKMQASIAQATEQARYNVALERVEEAYDKLNPDSGDFDKEVLGEVVEMKIFYERMRNMTPTQALQAAVRKILGQDDRSQEKATTVAPRVDKEDVAAERKKAAVAKTLDATNRTPANTGKVGLDSDKAGGALTSKDVMKMSQKDFSLLPDDVLARMRGDEI